MSLLHDLINVLHKVGAATLPSTGKTVSQAGAGNNRPGQGLGQPNYPNDPGFPLQGQGARPDIAYDPRPHPAPYTSNNMALVEALARRPFYTPLQEPMNAQTARLGAPPQPWSFDPRQDQLPNQRY